MSIPDFSTVGVFKFVGLGEERIDIRVKDICGKAIQVGKFVITVPFNILEETY